MTNGRSGALQPQAIDWMVTRRDFLKRSGVLVAGLSARTPRASADSGDRAPQLSFGIVTDAHYADADSRNARHYRESVVKMTECVTLMNDRKVDFLIELGDFKDQGTPISEASTLRYLDSIERVYGQFNGPRYHVLGNHDMDSLSKPQFLARVENTGIAKGATYYSFDSKGFHFVVLDANFTADESDYDHGKFNWTDSNIPSGQLEWLERDLAAASEPVIAFVHQQLDVTGPAGVKNAARVRRVLQENKRTLAVFQGHHHAGHHSAIDGIHYYTLKAMVEGSGEKNNSYAVVEVYDDRTIVVAGYRNALSMDMQSACPAKSASA